MIPASTSCLSILHRQSCGISVISGRARLTQDGFTITELLVSLVIGLFIIGGAMSVYVSSQVTYAEKLGMERAQEALRFGAFTISRIVRMASSVESDTSDDELVIAFQGGDGILDCAGVEKTEPVGIVNRFRVTGNVLECVDGEGNPQAIVEEVTGFSVRYCRLVDWSSCLITDYEDEDGGYVDRSELGANWGSVGSILVELDTVAGSVSFVVTLREKVFGLAN